ncbi:FBN1 (predicted) [Pycnogonum litorale]
MATIIDRNNEHLVEDCDKGMKNRFRWMWLEKQVDIGGTTVTLAEHIRKVDLPGKALCILCNATISYDSRGVKNIEDHCKSKKHGKNLHMKMTNHVLTTAKAKDSPTYGLHPMFVKAGEVREQVAKPKPIIPISDRVYQQQAMILGVIAENSLSLTTAPLFLEVAKELGKDRKALASNSMDRTSASYKMTHGLQKTIMHRTLDSIRQAPFSLNIDESTSSSHKRVLAVLVSYYSDIAKCVVVEHLTSLELIKVNAVSIYDSLVDFFDAHSIPWDNLVSILMDSCAVMRGSKSGLEQRIRETKAPQLLDIDGDICHHVHNASKKFCDPFKYWAEGLFCDIYADFKWSADLKDALAEICELLGLKFTTPARFLSHRWLSCYDVSVSTLLMMDAFEVFYQAFLPKDMLELYSPVMVAILRKRNVSQEARARIKEILQGLSKKKMTKDGQDRKNRVVEKLIYKLKETTLIMQFYKSVLPSLKSYACLFQTKEPLVHRLHDKQEELFRDFLSFFVKQEHLIGKSALKLKQMDLEHDNGQFMNVKDMYCGAGVKNVMKDSRRDDTTVRSFLNRACTAFMQCAQYLQKKLPLDNPVLRAVSAIDPVVRGHSQSCKALKSLKAMVPCKMSLDDEDQFDLQVHRFQVDDKLLAVDDDTRVDAWWASVMATNRYPALCSMVKAVLSIFHGPQVESSFNVMGDILDPKSSRMTVETFSSIQTVKYWLRSTGSSATANFRRQDPLYDPVDTSLCHNMRGAASSYKQVLQEKKDIKEKKRERLNLAENVISKAKAKQIMEEAEKATQLKFVQRQKRKARGQMLELLAAKRKDLN